MLRKPFFHVLLATSCATAAYSQAATANLPNAPSNAEWTVVQSLPTASEVYIRSKGVQIKCGIQHADANSIACDRGMVLQQADVETVKRPRKLVSTLAGAGIGIGVGMAIGEATYRRDIIGYSRGDAAAGGGFLFGVAGTLVGYFTDFARVTVYRRP